ncbi:MAG: PH domain-containing protein [Chitinophagales bacterium]
MYFEASLDTFSILLTSVLTGIILIIVIRNIIAGLNDLVIVFFTLLMVILLLLPLLYKINGYEIDSGKLIIDRVAYKIEIDIEDVKKVELLNPDDMEHSSRTFANGGLFGYYGKYKNPKIGAFKMYATQRSNRVLVVLENEDKIVITPDNLELYHVLRKMVAI